MEVVGTSKAKVVIASCLQESTVYFADHARIIRCNPFCTNVVYLKEHDLYQWVFQVRDPRDNPITAIFFVEQHEEQIDHHTPSPDLSGLPAGGARCIRWVTASRVPPVEIDNDHTFIGKADTRICLYHLEDGKTEVHFATDIALDFTLSFPLNMMPEGIIRFLSQTVMSQIMQQATESMLCKVQSDICCVSAAVSADGGKA